VFGGYTLYGITFLVQLTLDVLVYYNKLSMTEQTFLLSPKFGTQYLSDHEIRTVLHGATTENCSSKIKLDSSEQQAHKSKAVSFFFFTDCSNEAAQCFETGPMFFCLRVTRTKVRARFVTNGGATTTKIIIIIISKHKKGFWQVNQTLQLKQNR